MEEITVESYVEQKVHYYDQEGKEILVETPSEDVHSSTVINHLDFQVQENNLFEKPLVKNRRVHPFQKTVNTLSHSIQELDTLLNLVETVKKGSHLTVYDLEPVDDGGLDGKQMHELYYSKQKQISVTKLILDKGYEDMKQSIQSNRDYAQRMLELQKNWLLKYPNGRENTPNHLLDIGFGSISWKYSSVPIATRRTKNGLELLIPHHCIFGMKAVLASDIAKEFGFSIQNVLKYAQDSIFHREFFEYFLDLMMKENKIRFHSVSEFKVSMQLTPVKNLTMELTQLEQNGQKLPFWDVKISLNEEENSLMRVILLEAFLQSRRSIIENPQLFAEINPLVENKTRTAVLTKPFLNVFSHLVHKEIIQKLKDADIDGLQIISFKYPDQTKARIIEENRKITFYIEGTWIICDGMKMATHEFPEYLEFKWDQ